MNRNNDIEIIISEYRDNMSDEQKQKRREAMISDIRII